MLAASVYQADADHGAWSSHYGNRHAYPPIWRQYWVGWLIVPAEPERAFRCIARAIFARGRYLRLGDQRLPAVSGCLPLPPPAFRVRSLLRWPGAADAKKS
jgi:hypothetical protein